MSQAIIDYIRTILPAKPDERAVLGVDTVQMPVIAKLRRGEPRIEGHPPDARQGVVMTDLPQDPADPTRGEPPLPRPHRTRSRTRCATRARASRLPRSPRRPPPVGPPAPGPPAEYGRPRATRRAPGGTTEPPAAAQPGYPQPPANPYGGYSQAPAYAAGGGPAFPGNLAYVEQNFGKVASFGQRALAYLVDMALTLIGLVPAILGIILIAVGVPSEVNTDQFGNTTTSGDANVGLVVAGGLLIALGGLIALGITIWNRIFKMGRTGQSVGKKVIGLYLLDDKTGQPVGAGMTFLREIVNGLINQVIYLGWLWMLWDADKQTLGDKAVHSSVVVVPKG